MDRINNIPLLVSSIKDLSESDLKLDLWLKDQIGLVLSYLWLNIILKSGFKSLISRSFEVYWSKENFDLGVRILLRSKMKDYYDLKKEITEFRSFSNKLLNLQVVFFCNLSKEVLLDTLLTSHASRPCGRIYRGWGANVSYEWYLSSKGSQSIMNRSTEARPKVGS